MKRELEQWQLKEYSQTEEGRAYLKYNEMIGGEPLGLIVPFGYPKGVQEKGGVINVYNECIEKGVTWEELLNFKRDNKIIF